MTRPRRHVIALAGTPPSGWNSLDRTYSFYKSALAKFFAVVHCRDFPPRRHELRNVAAIVTFGRSLGVRGLTPQRHGRPILYSVFGGAVLEYEQLGQVIAGFSASERLLVNCSSDVEALASFSPAYRQLTEVLHLPVDTAVFFKQAKLRAKRALGIDTRQPVLGLVARLVPEKNLHLFVRLLAALHRTLRPQQRPLGLIVGDFWEDYPGFGESISYKQYVTALAAELDVAPYIKVLPARLSVEQLRTTYNCIDVLVHPTMCVDENYGYVPLEALACGTPVVTTAYGGLKDTLRTCPGAILHPTWITGGGIRTDWQSMLTGIAQLLASRGTQEIGAAGMQHIGRRFSPTVAASAFQRLVLRAIHGEPVAPPPVATTDGRGMAGQKIQVGALNPRWAAVAKPVSYYVSSPTPQVTAATFVYPYAGYRFMTTNIAQLQDPLWPARYAVAARHRRILERVHQGATAAALLAADCRLADIQELVNLGILVPIQAAAAM